MGWIEVTKQKLSMIKIPNRPIKFDRECTAVTNTMDVECKYMHPTTISYNNTNL